MNHRSIIIRPFRTCVPKKRAVLLDFDGVIFQNKKALDRVQDRIVEYVQQNVYNGYMNKEDAIRVNRDLYTTYGHTHLGMKKLFLPESRISCFNKFVYDQDFLSSLQSEFMDDELIRKNVKEFEEWVTNFYRAYGIPVYIFTNSPREWCYTWLKYRYIEGFRDIFSSDHVVFDSGLYSLLKPDPSTYKRLEYYFKKKFDNEPYELIFVDDSLTNLIPVAGNALWHPIWFKGDDDKSHFMRMENLNQIEQVINLRDTLP